MQKKNTKEYEKAQEVRAAGACNRQNNTCEDLFKNSEVMIKGHKTRMNSKKSNQKFFRDKRTKKHIDIQINKLKLLLGMRCLQGILFIRGLLQKIEYSKKIFVISIQEGDEVMINQDLTQNKLPMSFRFYDPLMQIVQERMTEDRQDYYKLKNLLKKEIYSQVDTKTKLFNLIGIQKQTINIDEKLTHISDAAKEKKNKQVNIYESVYTMGVQRSNYMQIDNELMNDLQENPQKVMAMTWILKKAQNKHASFITDNDCDMVTDQVYFKYCRDIDIKQKSQAILKFKAQFEFKISNLKNKGQMLTTKSQAIRWIDINIDMLYDLYKKSLIMKKKMSLLMNQGCCHNTQIQNFEMSPETPDALKGTLNRQQSKSRQITQKQEKSKLELNFKLNNKLAFITNDVVKEKFIQQIHEKQNLLDHIEKEKFRQFLKQTVEDTLTKRRERLFQRQFKEFNKVYSGNGQYADILTSIENAIEKDIIYFNKSNRQTDFNLIIVKEQIKKVEQQIKINQIIKDKKNRAQKQAKKTLKKIQFAQKQLVQKLNSNQKLVQE